MHEKPEEMANRNNCWSSQQTLLKSLLVFRIVVAAAANWSITFSLSNLFLSTGCIISPITRGSRHSVLSATFFSIYPVKKTVFSLFHKEFWWPRAPRWQWDNVPNILPGQNPHSWIHQVNMESCSHVQACPPANVRKRWIPCSHYRGRRGRTPIYAALNYLLRIRWGRSVPVWEAQNYTVCSLYVCSEAGWWWVTLVGYWCPIQWRDTSKRGEIN